MKRANRVLMFGWEFPPKNTGGLGTACFGLTKGLTKNKVGITLVLPYDVDTPQSDLIKVVSTGGIKVRMVRSMITPYMDYKDYSLHRSKGKSGHIYGRNLFEEVNRYADVAAEIAREETYDLIHCHDWMTFIAGARAKEISGKPMIVHVHSTEFDRTGGNGVNQYVYDIERHGMEIADYIIAVSNYTKNKIVNHYGISSDKVHVVHNAVEQDTIAEDYFNSSLKKNNKIVLFLGRITLQKGPDYFVYAARKALEIMPNILFVVAGNGDMERYVIEKSAEFGIADRFIFTGFLSGYDVDRIYRMADLYVMPSVSEPFGITALEAMKNHVPVLMSRQSGVSEVVSHCLKIDFWDINQIVNKMISVLQNNALKECLEENALGEVRKFSWDKPARQCIEIYERAINCYN